MRILSFDPGAKRAGWAVLYNGPKYMGSGVVEFPPHLPIGKKKELYQVYRMRLTQHWVDETLKLIKEYEPHYIVTEIVPYKGMNDFGQGYLANVMATVVHAISLVQNTPVFQVSAVKVQHAIAVGGNTERPTKPQVRKGVIERLPELDKKLKAAKVFEESDALAIALWFYDIQVN